MNTKHTDDPNSNQHFFERLENSPLGVIEWDRDFRITHWSHKAEEIFGWSAEEVVGKNLLDWRFIYEDDLPRVLHLARRVAEGEWLTSVEHNRNYTKDGRVIDCTWYNSAQINPRGRMTSLFSLVLDETEARRVQSQLKRQTERLEMALSASSMIVFDWDMITGTIDWTGDTRNLLGFPPHKAPKDIEYFKRHVHPEDFDRIGREACRALEEHDDFEVVIRVIDSTQESGARWLRARGRGAYDETGRALCLSGTILDMSDSKQIEDRLDTSRKFAETASALKSAFVANMSHEIRTPLGVILGFAELLSDPEIGLGERHEYMEIINRNGEHLSRLIDDVLDLSKVEAGKLEIHTERTRLAPLLEEVLSNLQPKAFIRNLSLRLETIGRVPEWIDTDPLRFRQILVNLISNAIKFTPSGTVSVIVATRQGVGSRSLLSIRVRDSGVGISGEGQARLFEPFTQADQTVNRGYGGTGLGLSLSRRLARSLDGDVRLVRSVPGEGSEFEFWFDCPTCSGDMVLGTAITPAAQKEVIPVRLEGVRILLAEDSIDNQLLMDRILRRQGACVEFAQDGVEAVDKAHARDYDVILMDIQMPRMDGYQATQKLRSHGYSKSIIALSAHAMKEERQRSIDAGCDAHLAKPVSPQELFHAISAAVEMPRIKRSGEQRPEARRVLETTSLDR